MVCYGYQLHSHYLKNLHANDMHKIVSLSFSLIAFVQHHWLLKYSTVIAGLNYSVM